MKMKMDLQKNHRYKQLKGPTTRPSKNLKKNPTTKQEHKYPRKTT
jgi:hypothetical protein